MRNTLVLTLAGFVTLMGVLLLLDQPRIDRDWSPDQAVPATAEISDREVTVKNVRNFTYRSTTDYTPGYYDTTVKLSELESVDYIVEPFGDIGAAHTFLSFGFSNGQQIAISAEIRKEKGETFSPLKGLLRQYELMYVIADERDVIGLRANHRGHDVYLYPTTATGEEAKALFISMLERTNSLISKPEFYNTILSNCTTNIASHLNKLWPGTVGLDYRLLLPENSDALAQELGLIAPELTLEEARARHRINDAAWQASTSEQFSVRLRESFLPIDTPAGSHLVVAVLDGDTIEVESPTGERERVRYIGVDSPEMNYDTMTPQCLAAEAKLQNEELVLGRFVTLTGDVGDRDTYGRLLRYVEIDGQDVGEVLLSSGYATTLTIPPNVARAGKYTEAETKAREAGSGLWGEGCVGSE